MEEQVARAVNEELLRQYLANPYWDPHWDDPKEVIENIDTTKIVGTIFAAMRDPTPEMIEAIAETFASGRGCTVDDFHRDLANDAWHAAIYAAVLAKKEPK